MSRARDQLVVCGDADFIREMGGLELTRRLKAVLKRVKRGEGINITERGSVIARLIPASEHPLAVLMESGKLHPATVSAPAPRPTGPVRTDHEAGELLREMRDSDRY